MSLIFRIISKKNGEIQKLISRSASHYNHHWKPGPYPKTAEERAEAAKKYGLRPEDYMPFPDDGLAIGDYPYIKPFNLDNRDPWEFYDYYPERRNYNECLSMYHEVFRTGQADPEPMSQFAPSASKVWAVFFMFVPFTLIFLLGILDNRYKYFNPVMTKQFPYDTTEKHYLFESP